MSKQNPKTKQPNNITTAPVVSTQDELHRKRLPFTMVENSIIEDERIKRPELLVYLVLCYHADNKSRDCFPGLSLIAKEARCGRSTVWQAIQKLIKLGYITKQNRKKKDSKEFTSNIYTLTGVSASDIPISASDIPISASDTRVSASGREQDSGNIDSNNERETLSHTDIKSKEGEEQCPICGHIGL